MTDSNDSLPTAETQGTDQAPAQTAETQESATPNLMFDDDQVTASPVDEPQEAPAALATATEEATAEEPLSDKAQKAINKQHFKFREEQRRADALEKRLQDLEAKQQQSTQSDITVPPMPDTWDDNFEAKVKAREEALTLQAQRNAQQQLQEEQAQFQRQQQELAEQQRVQELANSFNQNATRLGVDSNTLAEAQNALVSYGVTRDIANALLADEAGPLMVQYMAANPLEMGQLINASPLQQGMMLSDIKAKAGQLKPKTTSAPPPPTQGGGTSTGPREKGPKGAIYE